MHGRLKVKTTAQQEREKAVERAGKLQHYRKAMSAVLTRRAAGCRDGEQLKLTAALLLANPDIGTLWNVRREVVTFMSEAEPDQADAVWAREVELTQQALTANPKSYGAWHHRAFSLDRRTESREHWQRELGLCDRFLSMDERNFHCWDYRQLAAKRAGRGAEEELEFTMERINSNFSNYSAWHYRSKLLPRTSPDNRAWHHAELDLVQNAAFTDPDDSSAWLYQSWLVGGHTPAPPPHLLAATMQDRILTVATSAPVPLAKLLVTVEGVAVEWEAGPSWRVEWRSQELQAGIKTSLTVTCLGEELRMELGEGRQQVLASGAANIQFQPRPGSDTASVLETELDNCSQLLELEPESKWTLAMKALLLRALDPHRHNMEILDLYAQLQQVDCLRARYYEDMKAKLIIENALESSQNFDCLDLSSHKLSRTYHKQYLNLFREVKY